jgi:hypothetical protein
MRWLLILLLVLALAGTCIAPMMLVLPDLDWLDGARWPAAAFALLAGTWVCASLVFAYEDCEPRSNAEGWDQ